MAFEIAARAAFREAMPKANAVLLEPMMKVEVVTPEDYMGDIIGDLNSRRGQVSGMEQRGINHVVNGMVPLANMFGYVNNLRSMSQGRASYTMTFLIIMSKSLIMLLRKLRKSFWLIFIKE